MRKKLVLTCDGCGKKIEKYKNTKKNKYHYCSSECMYKNVEQYYVSRGKGKVKGKTYHMFKWLLKNVPKEKTENEMVYVRTYEGKIERVKRCYLKEARAILQGKHWEGKNRCTKLVGDE